MKVVKETIVAGKTIHRMIKVPSGNHRKSRKSKCQITSDCVQKNNYRLAVKKLWMLINANFGKGSSHITLTYGGEEPTKQTAATQRKSFLRKLRRELKKNEQELKYIAVTEYENKRIHHHIVVNTIDINLINQLWKIGFIHSTPLDNSGDYHDLAEYLIKETEKTFRNPDSAHKHRYSPSRNLIKPVIKREYVDAKEFSKEPEAIPGYYIPKERYRTFEHPVTGLPHKEYLMIALGDPRKYKSWPRGATVNRKEYYKINYEEQQESFEIIQ